ncbi:unnamed protein product [Eretmochelys imbricata]
MTPPPIAPHFGESARDRKLRAVPSCAVPSSAQPPGGPGRCPSGPPGAPCGTQASGAGGGWGDVCLPSGGGRVNNHRAGSRCGAERSRGWGRRDRERGPGTFLRPARSVHRIFCCELLRM